jgi:hypothetical protein
VIVFTNLGDQSLEYTSPGFIVAIGMLILLLVSSYIMKKGISFNKMKHNIIEKEVK